MSTCIICQSAKTVEFRYPKRNMGVVLIILGALFLTFLIGIPILLWGIDMCRFREDWWRCSGCGATTPITAANCPTWWRPPTFVPAWKVAGVALLGVGALLAVLTIMYSVFGV